MPAIPAPGLGKKSLAALCDEFGLELGNVLELLSGNGIQATADETLRQIADRYETSPGEIYEIIRLAQQ